jgi:secreted trypsin-like serine protease
MIITESNNMLWLLTIILLSIIRSSHQTTYPCNSSASCGCSTNSATLTRIVGGENAASATWGWAVSISIGGSYLCGGSIISSSWVITAAHCVYGGYTASQITIYAGSNLPWSGTQSSTGANLFIHPSYNPSTYVNDLALLELTTPLTMSDPDVSTICLPIISSSILAAGEWPAVGTSVSYSFSSLFFVMSVFNIIQ